MTTLLRSSEITNKSNLPLKKNKINLIRVIFFIISTTILIKLESKIDYGNYIFTYIYRFRFFTFRIIIYQHCHPMFRNEFRSFSLDKLYSQQFKKNY